MTNELATDLPDVLSDDADRSLERMLRDDDGDYLLYQVPTGLNLSVNEPIYIEVRSHIGYLEARNVLEGGNDDRT